MEDGDEIDAMVEQHGGTSLNILSVIESKN